MLCFTTVETLLDGAWGCSDRTPTLVSLCRYDRQKLTLREVHSCQYVACMNPTSGSFTIDPRLQVGGSWTHCRNHWGVEGHLGE